MPGPVTAFAAAALSLALGGAVRLPPWPLSPDGELVAAEGDSLAATGARTEPAGRGLWLVGPAPGAAEVRLASGSDVATARVGPPVGRVAVEAIPARPVKGRDAEVRLRLAVLDAGGRPDAEAGTPRLAVNVGTVRDLAPGGPGRFTARYDLPASRHPEVAVLVALVPRCPLCPTPLAVGGAAIPLAAAVDLPGRTEPHVRVTVEIAGRTFGPVEADEEGRFRIPAVVPPGERLGRGESVDALGNRRSEEIDFRPPPAGRLSCLAWPPSLPADGRSEAGVFCMAADPAGRPARQARLEAAARLGRVTQPEPAGGAGLFRLRYRAPRGGGGKRDAVRVALSAAGAASAQEMEIALATGAPVDLGYVLEREPAPAGSTVGCRTFARDARGDALAPPRGPPGSAAGFVAPDRFLAARGGGWTQQAELRSVLPPEGEVARLWLWREGDQWVAAARGVGGGPVPGADLTFGSGASARTDERGEARVSARGDEETARAPSGARAAGWKGFRPEVPAASLSRTFTVAIAPPAPVDVRARVERGVLRWEVRDAEGRPLAGRPVRLEAAGPTLGRATADGDGGRCSVAGVGTVAVVDAETGVAAVVEVR